MEAFGYQQHVKSPTQRYGPVLDVILTSSDLCVAVAPINPPSLSDHSFVIAELTTVPNIRPVSTTRFLREWFSLDVDEFACDLVQIDLFRSPPTDVHAALETWNAMIQHLGCWQTSMLHRSVDESNCYGTLVGLTRNVVSLRELLTVLKETVAAIVLLTIWRHGVSSSTNSVCSTTPSLSAFGRRQSIDTKTTTVSFGALPTRCCSHQFSQLRLH